MTEEEAKATWCHRFNHEVGAHRRMRDGSFEYACIGSACAAWRGGKDQLGPIIDKRLMDYSGVPPEGFVNTAVIDTGCVSQTYWVKYGPSVPTGYCGLAGKPE